MSFPEVVSREEWLAARKALLAKEKELTRATDGVNAARRRLPMTRVEKDYPLDGPSGPAKLPDLFGGKRQLAVYHFMFGPDWEAGCPGCTAAMDEVAPGLLAHIAARDTAFAVVSRAPLDKIQAYKTARGWTAFDWYSSYGSDFNHDLGVTFDASVAPVQFNYRDATELAGTKDEWAAHPDNQPTETSGISFFLRDDDAVYHTYSTYQRGTEALVTAFHILDLSPLGRQEDWEEPKGRAGHAGPADPSFGGGLVSGM
jgi:predicted dithiol-disulfide oxidoreductase (DUF899 family)